MDLSPYADALRIDLASLGRATGPDAEELLERLSGPLDAAVRLVIQEAVSDAAQEISRELAPGSVDVRVRGRDLGFVVTPAPEDATGLPGPPVELRRPETSREGPEAGTARLTVRLTDQLKSEVEAAAGREGLSVNAFLVRMLAAAVQPGSAPAPRQASGAGNRISGWAT